MNSRYVLFLLSGLYPVAFFASSNWFVFNASQILLLVVTVAATSLVLLSILDSVSTRILALGASGGRGQAEVDRISDGFRVAAALVLCGYLSRRTLTALPIPVVLAWLSALALVAAASWFAYIHGTKPVAAALLGLTLMAAAQWGYSYYALTTQLRGDHWYNGARALSEEVAFSKTPNVYFLLAESYPNRQALETIYGIDNEPFYEDLKERGLTLFHDAFSNYHATVSSLASVFAMSHHYGKIEIGRLDAFSARDVISGRIFNAVVETFRRNGYFIQYVHETDYQLLEGASLDYYWPVESRAGALDTFLGTDQEGGERRFGRSQTEFRAEVSRRLDTIRTAGQPHFTYIYLVTPGHSPYLLKKTPRNLEKLAAYRRQYPRTLAQANPVVLEVVDEILAADPIALIIVAGDHGSWGYRLLVMEDGQPAPSKLIAVDRLGVLTAIRFPQPYDGASEKDTISHVNLFRHVFAYLSGSDEVLATREPDDGYTKLDLSHGEFVRALEDGQPLDTFSDVDE